MARDIGPADTGYYEAMVAQNAGDSMLVTDADGFVVWVNEAFTRKMGYALGEMRGQKPGSILQGDETDPRTIANMSEAIKARRPVQIEILNFTKTGTPTWIELQITPVFDENGSHTHFISLQRDITERRAIEEKSNEILRQEKHREEERILMGQVSEWLYSAKSLDELLLVTRKGMETLLPEAEGSLYIYSADRDALDVASVWGQQLNIDRLNPDQCWSLRRGRAYAFGIRAIEFPCEHVEDDRFPYFCLPIVAHGETIGLLHLRFTGLDLKELGRENLRTFVDQRWRLSLICAEQISLAVANVRLRQELLDQSVRDPLTNLWNRRWLQDTARRMIDGSRDETTMSVISVDVDYFKKFNDIHGHDAGDAVLRETAGLLVSLTKDSGAACRVGGEEFVVLCPGLDLKQAADLAENIRTAFTFLDLRHGGVSLPQITVSIGVASHQKGQDITELLTVADRMLYRAKETGRNKVVVAGCEKSSRHSAPTKRARRSGGKD